MGMAEAKAYRQLRQSMNADEVAWMMDLRSDSIMDLEEEELLSTD